MAFHHHFTEQRPDETIVLWIEKHWIRFVKVLSLFLFLGAIPGIAIFFVATMAFTDNDFARALLLCFGLMYELLVILYCYITLLLDELDLFVVTDQRLVDITQENLFHRRVADTPLENIQDATAEQKGFLPTILNYGDVSVQTAGKKSEFMMDLVPRSFDMSKRILEIASEKRSSLREKQAFSQFSSSVTTNDKPLV